MLMEFDSDQRLLAGTVRDVVAKECPASFRRRRHKPDPVAKEQRTLMDDPASRNLCRTGMRHVRNWCTGDSPREVQTPR